MIDLHFHCLPGIDDGPETWDEAVALCRAAAEDGVEMIVATPHVLRDDWMNEDARKRDELVFKLNALLGGSPGVVAGCEYYFSADAADLWEMGSAGPLVGLNRSSYLLTEFPATFVPPYAESVFHELALLGVTPVIAHPERNAIFIREPHRLASLIERGAITQVTAASITGEFGRPALNAATDLLRRGLVDVVASDSHSLRRRPPRMGSARERIRRDFGEELAARLFDRNPGAVVRGETIQRDLAPSRS